MLGQFVVSVTANTMKEIASASDLVSGTLPSTVSNAFYNVVSHSSQIVPADVSTDGTKVCVYCEKTQNLTIKWFEYKP